MIKPEGTIHKLYTSFQVRDWKTMQSCYHEEAAFSDPVFQDLNGREVRAMWHMLVAAARDLKVIVGEVEASEGEGGCRWQAWYTFSKTGRPVHNIIRASFLFKDGKIIRHRDDFDFWRWSGMALGLPGTLLGWTPLLRNKVRKTARKALVQFMGENPQYKR